MGLSLLAWVVITAVGVLTASAVMANKQKKAMEDAQAGILVQKQGGTHPIPIVYGERRLAPTKVWEDISKQRLPVSSPATSADSFFTHNNEASYPSSRDDEDFLHRIDVWCQGPIESITRIEIDDDSVHTHKRFTTVKNNRPLYRGLHKHGATSQSMFTELANGFSGITTSMKGNGIAWSWNSFMYTADRPQYYGDPKLTALVKGVRLWDPRVNPTNSSVKAWSSNPALVLLDYLTADYGKALAVSDLDIPSFIAAANECDIVVNLPAAVPFGGAGQLVYVAAIGEYVFIPSGDVNPNGGTDTQKERFTCNIVLQPDVDSKENVAEILKTFKGALPFINGKYVLSMEVAATSVMSFDNSNIIDGVSISYGDRSKRLNQVTVKFPNALKGYKEDAVTWPKSTDAQYTSLLAEDSGEKLTTEAKISGVTSFYQAEDLAEFMVRDSRNQRSIVFRTQPLALQLEPNDIITVTTGALNYVAQPYRVREVKLGKDLTVEVIAQEYDPTIYPWHVGNAEPVPEYTPNKRFATPADMQNVAGTGVTLVNVDTTANTNIVVTWDAIVSGTSAVDIIQIGYKLQGDTEYAWNVIPPEQTETTLVGLQDDATYDIIARYRNMVGNTSDNVTITVITPDAETGFTDGIDGVNGLDGANGVDGLDGTNGINGVDGSNGQTSYFHVAYADTINGGGFSQSPSGKDYIGTYVDFTTADSSTASDYSWKLIAGAQGEDGTDGINGVNGDDGTTSYLHIAYADTASGGGLSQSPTNKKYIGTYVDGNPTDSTSSAAYTWALYVGDDGADGVDGIDGVNGLDGANGIDGIDGDDGINGEDGDNGQTTYFHVAYADTISGGGFSQSPSGKDYIGTYVDFTQADSSTASDYSWKLIAGAQGEDGTDGLAGENGIDGTTQYLHIAYADDITGNGFSQSPTNKGYIGIYVDSNSTDSSTASDYTWTLYVGTDGTDGADGIDGVNGLDGAHGVDGLDGTNGINGINGDTGQTTYFHVAYADTISGGGFSQSPSGKDYIGTYVDFTQADSSSASAYTWKLIAGAQGEDGTDGIDGVNGDDGTTSYLHIAYADTISGGGFSQSPINKAYIGTYINAHPNDPNYASAYTWVKFVGDNGTDGTDGTDGDNGNTTYFHIAYADTSTGGGLSQSPINKYYIGTYTDTNPTDSTSASAYTWRRYVGHNGNHGINGTDGTNGTNGTNGGIGPQGPAGTAAISWSMSGGSFSSISYMSTYDSTGSPSSRSSTIYASPSSGSTHSCSVTVTTPYSSFYALSASNVSVTDGSDANGTFSVTGKTVTSISNTLKRVNFTVNHSTSGGSINCQCFLTVLI